MLIFQGAYFQVQYIQVQYTQVITKTSFCMMSCTGAAGWGMDAATVSTSRRK